jgi:hypothetical protein
MTSSSLLFMCLFHKESCRSAEFQQSEWWPLSLLEEQGTGFEVRPPGGGPRATLLLGGEEMQGGLNWFNGQAVKYFD